MRSRSVNDAWDTFSRKSEKKKKKDLRIEEIDPTFYRNREVKQARLHHLWNPKKWAKSAKCAIAKFFIYENIPPSKAQGYFYQMMIDEIALAGVGLKRPTPYEIGGPLLDDEIEELREYIEQFKKKFETYGVTIMCDGWSSITRQSIINFLVYCDGNIVFHRSVNTSSYDKDANYIFQLMDQVVEEIGERYVVQMITDNHAAYKKAGELLMEKRRHLYWTPCATHSLDLILHDFAQIEVVHNILDEAKKVTNFIYNHNRILDIMRNYCTGELIRPGQTRFATNYIALQSILDQKSGLQRMFTSEDWSKSAASRDPAGKKVHASILNPKFWERAKKIVAIHAPIAKVLRMVDGEKKATMPYVYEAMKRAKKAVKEIAPKSCKKYLDIVDARWKKIIIQPIHMAAYYLNPAYHYEEDVRVKDSLLGSLRVVISRLETNPNRASQALAEVKIFREAMYGFAEQAEIRGRTRIDPAEWWFLYGTDAPNLRKIAMRILSQTASSSGCERNWSTFALIHTKVRNRLNYQKLERLVFAQYNLRLKLKHFIKEERGVDFKPIDLTTVFEEDEEGVGISEWLDDPGDALLDELDDDGQPNRPNTFLATWANHYSDDDMGRPSQSKSSMFPRNSRAESSRGRQATVTLSSDDDDEDDDDGDGDDGDDNNNEEDSDSDDGDGDGDDGTGGRNFGGSQTENWERQSPNGIAFTKEQGFTHATQDEDHGSRHAIMRGMDMINRGLSSMSMSESEHDRRGGSSSSYGCGSGYDQPYEYDPRGYNLHTHGYGSSTYGYGSGYDSQASSSHGYGPALAPAPAPAQREG
ncbi:hypothetical protein F0562_022646 [Nyssa sinensis]|uniref:DUF659 domain-containing protein n=1 Tax=Nyssa sinensis TaxID=561372 RepID=A0A5J5BPQ9_9ASTE|nr:hypothetical protein F0562_022646 [Nyssa sinensis]